MPAPLSGPGRADLHLGQGRTLRPDTLMQTAQLGAQKPLADGADPTLKWTALRDRVRAKEDHDAEEETQARGDRCEAAPGGRAGVAGAERCRRGTLDWGYGGHVLPLAPRVWRAQERSGQATEGSRD